MSFLMDRRILDLCKVYRCVCGEKVVVEKCAGSRAGAGEKGGGSEDPVPPGAGREGQVGKGRREKGREEENTHQKRQGQGKEGAGEREETQNANPWWG